MAAIDGALLESVVFLDHFLICRTRGNSAR